MSLKIPKKSDKEYYNALYSDNQIKNEYIYRDIRNKRLHRTFKILLASIISGIPTVGALLQTIAKLLV